MQSLSRKFACIIGMIAILAACLVAPVPSYAEGTLEIDPSDGVARGYNAWKVLGGTVSESEGSLRLTDVSYTDALTAEGWQELGAPAGAAQDVAEWLGRSMSPTLANEIDWKVEGSGARADVTGIEAGKATTLDDGYWLIGSDSSSAVLVLVGGGQASKVTEKAEAPTLMKQVASDGDWSDFAVAGAGLDARYRLVGTIPSNYDSFPSYRYEFDDTADAGLAVDASSVKVVASAADGSDERDITPLAEISAKGSGLTVTFQDLKSALPERGSLRMVTVTYSCRITPHATMGLGDTNANTATLSYTKKPAQAQGASARASMGTVHAAVAHPGLLVAASSDGMATTERQMCEVATWSIRVSKVDAEDASALSGAGFTVRDSQGRYINTDATATESMTDASVWRTGEDGTVAISCLPNGTFTLHEEEVPEGHEAAPDATVELDGDRSGLRASAQGATVTSTDATSGTVGITVEDPRTPVPATDAGTAGKTGKAGGTLADTGDTTRAALIAVLAAAGILAICIAVRTRKASEKGDRK